MSQHEIVVGRVGVREGRTLAVVRTIVGVEIRDEAANANRSWTFNTEQAEHLIQALAEAVRR